MTRRRFHHQLLDAVRTVASAFVAYLAFTTVAFAQFGIPSESMVPHLEVGDRVLVSKFAYGYSRHSLPTELARLLPAGQHRLFERTPRRGDVAVFMHPVQQKVMIKRVIAVQGDMVAVRKGVLEINGAPMPTTLYGTVMRRAHGGGLEVAERFEETFPGESRHTVHSLRSNSEFDDFGPFVVPAGHVFMMGDNRDNSLDSRWEGMGPVPIDNFIGRAEMVHVALKGCAPNIGEDCPKKRWMRPLHD